MTIIASTDFSQTAQNAVYYAAAMAKDTAARLILYNAYSFPIHASNALLPATTFQQLFDTNIERLQAEADVISQKFGIEIIAESSFSFIEDALKDLILKYDAEFLVLGMADRSLEQDMMGNTTTSAIKNLRIPILAVPARAHYQPPKKVLFACDNPTSVPQNILDRVKQIVDQFKGELEIFNVDETVKELTIEHPEALARNALNTKLQGINYYYKNVRSNAVVKEIEKEIEAFKADMLIMVPREYGFWSSMVHRSKTRIMASGLNVPLLSIPVGL